MILVALDKYIDKNENKVSVILTILVLILIATFGEIYFIFLFIFIFCGVKIAVLASQMLLSSFITPEQEKAYETKLKQRLREKIYKETRIGLNISKNDWNSYLIEKKDKLESLYSRQKWVIYQDLLHKNPNRHIPLESVQYFNLISETNRSSEWRNLSVETRISLIEKYEQLQSKRRKEAKEEEEKLKEKKKRGSVLEEQKRLLKVSESTDNDFSFKFLKYAGIVLIFLILITFGSRKKIGAKCSDGTSSYSTGSGTCSNHNGVSSWKYKYWWD